MAVQCKICDTRYINEVTFQQHLNSKSHLKNVSYNNSIFMHNFLKYCNLTDLLKFFSQYGGVKNYKLIGHNEDNIIIEFKNWETVKVLLEKQVYFKDLKLNISQLKHVSCKEYFTKSIKYDDIKAAIIGKRSFNEQLTAFVNEICLTDAEIKLRYEATCKEINTIFQNYFPRCKVVRFGSTISGLGFKKCDLDISLKIGVPVIDQKSSFGPHIVLKDDIFSKIEMILRCNKSKFSDCILIPQSKVPLIKFLYHPTKIACDLSFENNFGFYNSQMIKFYLSIDSRFKQMMIVIKYWIDVCEKKSNVGITKYTLTILFIFYLQQIQLAPPLTFLQKKCIVPVTINGWQINFNKVLEDFHTDTDSARKSIPDLLLEFFEFYADYDFMNNVICPIDGKSHNKELFVTLKNLPKSMTRYKDYIEQSNYPKLFTVSRCMCVQDPIELNVNISKNILRTKLERFQLFCSFTAILIKNSSVNNYESLLHNIFSMHDYSSDYNSKS